MKNKKTTYVIAEAGVNHNGSVRLAKKLIDVAANAGADAVKFQTFRAEALVTAAMPKAVYQRRDRASGSTQFEMLKKLELSDRDHKELYRHAEKRGIEFLSTPFDEKRLDFLVELGVKKIKIPSGEITNGPLLVAAARTSLPVILSTGMASVREIEQALGALAFGYATKRSEAPSRRAFCRAYQCKRNKRAMSKKVVLMQCTSGYPTPLVDVNILAMDTLRKNFGLPIGLSDHSVGINSALAAVARGACVIEKHFTLNRNLEGPDHRASLEPLGLRSLVVAVREIESAMGNGVKRVMPSEAENLFIARKSIVAARPIQRGEKLTVENLTTKRAGKGLSPMFFWDLLGKTVKRDFCENDNLNLSDVS